MKSAPHPDAEHIECAVVICVLNGAQTLRVQLDALSQQRGAPPFEVLVVDNGSTDSTTEVYRVWARGDIGSVSATRLVDATAQPGLAYARNCGASAATGHVLAYCDADDRVAPGWVAAACSAIQRGNHAVGGQVRSLLPNGQPGSEILMDGLDGISATQWATTAYPFFWGCNFALTREAFATVGGFDESLPPYGCDDIDIGVRLGERRIPIRYAPDMVVYYAPPNGLRRRMKRKFRAGIAQACLWQRHPRTYSVPSPLQLALTLPRDVRTSFRMTHSTRARILRSAESVATRLGQAWGWRTWVRSGRLGPARYFEMTPQG